MGNPFKLPMHDACRLSSGRSEYERYILPSPPPGNSILSDAESHEAAPFHDAGQAILLASVDVPIPTRQLISVPQRWRRLYL